MHGFSQRGLRDIGGISYKHLPCAPSALISAPRLNPTLANHDKVANNCSIFHLSFFSIFLSFLPSFSLDFLALTSRSFALYSQFFSPSPAFPAIGCLYFCHSFLSSSGPLLQYSNTSQGKSSVCIISLPKLTLQPITHHTQHVTRAVLTCFPDNLITFLVSFSSQLTGNADDNDESKFIFPQPLFWLALHPTIASS